MGALATVLQLQRLRSPPPVFPPLLVLFLDPACPPPLGGAIVTLREISLARRAFNPPLLPLRLPLSLSRSHTHTLTLRNAV